jgi:hypothetical protein
MQQPCEKCGHCPACGRGGINVYPCWQYIPQPQPTWWWTQQPYSGTTITYSNDTNTSLVN